MGYSEAEAFSKGQEGLEWGIFLRGSLFPVIARFRMESFTLQQFTLGMDYIELILFSVFKRHGRMSLPQNIYLRHSELAFGK